MALRLQVVVLDTNQGMDPEKYLSFVEPYRHVILGTFWLRHYHV